MLLDSQRNTSPNKRDFVREAGAITMPSKDQKPTSAAAAQVTAPRVPDRPDLSSLNNIPRPESLDEFESWVKKYAEQAGAELVAWGHAYEAQARRDTLKDLGSSPSVVLGIR